MVCLYFFRLRFSGKMTQIQSTKFTTNSLFQLPVLRRPVLCCSTTRGLSWRTFAREWNTSHVSHRKWWGFIFFFKLAFAFLLTYILFCSWMYILLCCVYSYITYKETWEIKLRLMGDSYEGLWQENSRHVAKCRGKLWFYFREILRNVTKFYLIFSNVVFWEILKMLFRSHPTLHPLIAKSERTLCFAPLQ